MGHESKLIVRELTTLIVEPDPDGHRLNYVRLLVDWCSSHGRRVHILTTSTAFRSKEWSVHLAQKSPEVVLLPPDAFSLAKIASVAKGIGADTTVLPEGDRYLLEIVRYGWSGSGELSLLVMRAEGQRGQFRWIRGLRGAAKKTVAWSAGLRSKVRVYALCSPLVRRRGPLQWIPDPVTLECTEEQKDTARRLLEADGARYWIGVFGVITPRKNVPLIIQAITREPGIGLLIAGTIDESVSAEVDTQLEDYVAHGGVVKLLPGTLSDAAFDAAISSVDCVIVAHSNEGPSGIVLKAAALGRRLILSGAKSLRRDAATLGQQATWSPLEVGALRNAVRQARSSAQPNSVFDFGTGASLAKLASVE